MRQLDNSIFKDFSSFLANYNNDTYVFNAAIIDCNNQKAVALVKNPQYDAKNKHINIQWHYQQEKVKDSLVDLQYISIEEQVADGLTKALLKNKFLIF